MTLALPSPRQEAWRWSDLTDLPAIMASTTIGPGLDPDAFWLGRGARLLFIDGRYDAALSDPGAVKVGPLPAGVTGTSDHALGKMCDGPGWTLFPNLHTEVSQLVEILHISTGSANHMPAYLDLPKSMELSICETFVGDGWANRLTHIHLGAGSTLHRLVRLMQDTGYTSMRDEIALEAGSCLHAKVLGLGGASTRVDASIALNGLAVQANYGGVLLAGQDQRHDVVAVTHHQSPGGASRQTWRAIALDQANVSVASCVEINREAQQTDATQSLKGLLANQGASINLKPEMVIYADDVKAAHGATVGALDQEALHYLASRGIPPQEAKRLLVASMTAQEWQGDAALAVQAGIDGPIARWLERML